MNGSINFRPICPDDHDFLYRLYASTREAEMALTDWDDAQKETFLKMQFQAQHTYYHEVYPAATFEIILVDGARAGRLYLNRGADEIRIVDIALMPDYRNRGIGSHVLHDVLAAGREVGLPVRIHVERFNPALHLYYRLGFYQLEDKGVYFLLEWNPQKET